MVRPRFKHLAAGPRAASLWPEEFLQALETLGEIEIVDGCASLEPERISSICRSADVLLTGWGSLAIPSGVAEAPGNLRYICHLTGTLRDIVPVEIIRSGIPVTNWGDTPAKPVAEAALALLLACLHNLRAHCDAKRAGGWAEAGVLAHSGSMEGLRVGIYGFGAIGRRFAVLARALGAKILIYDPFCKDTPEGQSLVDSLDALFEGSHAVSIHAALTEQTRSAVGAKQLARLPDGGILVNTARGALVDEKALVDELVSGRLRAGLDVLCSDEAPPAPDHPLRSLPNVILTAHRAAGGNWPAAGEMRPLHHVALDNLRRFLSGGDLLWRMDENRYLLST